MKMDLYAVRKIRTLKISEPVVWVSIEELVTKYNKRWGTNFVSKFLKKLIMHNTRMERVLERMIKEGYYQHDIDKGYLFLTKDPNKKLKIKKGE